MSRKMRFDFAIEATVGNDAPAAVAEILRTLADRFEDKLGAGLLATMLHDRLGVDGPRMSAALTGEEHQDGKPGWSCVCSVEEVVE